MLITGESIEVTEHDHPDAVAFNRAVPLAGQSMPATRTNSS